MKSTLRAGLKSGLTISITGYDLELGKFDCSDNITRTFDDIDYFIVTTAEMKNISSRLSSKIETTKKVSKKSVTDEVTEEIHE